MSVHALLQFIIYGITAISAQIIFIRELLSIFYGNEISIGLILGSWLAWGSIGAFWPGIFKKYNSEKKYSLIQILTAVLIPSTVIFIRIARNILGAPAMEIAPITTIFLYSFFMVAPVSFLLGVMFSTGAGIINSKRISSDVRRVYILESIGAGLGGFVTSIFMIGMLGNFISAVLLGFLNIITGLSGRSNDFKPVRYLLAILIIAGLASGLFNKADYAANKAKWAGMNLIESKDSIYSNIAFLKNYEEFSVYLNGVHALSVPARITTEESVHFPMLLHPHPKNILALGCGVGDIFNELLKYDIGQITYVEQDPELIRMADKHFKNEQWYRLHDKKVKLIIKDIRAFISSCPDKFDVIIISLPPPYTASLNRFYTNEFYSELKKISHDGSIVCFGITSSENYISPDLAAFMRIIYKTLRSVFLDVKVIPGDFALFISSLAPNSINISAEQIENSRLKRKIHADFVRKEYISSKLSPDRMAYIDKVLNENIQDVRINRDYSGLAFYYDMILWGSYYSEGISRFFRSILGLKYFYLGLIVSLMAVFFIYLKFFARQKRIFSALFSVGMMGISMISFQILTILVFQVTYGNLYLKLGVIMSCFMLGLAIGAFLPEKYRLRPYDPFNLLKTAQSGMVLYSILIMASFYFLPRFMYGGDILFGVNWIFIILPAIAGILGGLEFSAVNMVCEKQYESSLKLAGASYSADLAGSCIGALGFSIFLVPLGGIYGSCLILVFLNLFSLLILNVKENK